MASGGAGVVVQLGTTPKFSNCTITLNWVGSAGKGGGMFLPGQSVGLKIEDCTFIDNEGGDGGGGLLIKAISTASLTDCIFLQNQVPSINPSNDGGGGLLICSDSNATLRGCTFTKNVA